MNQHLWFYSVKFGKVLDLLTLDIWIDHGFETWSNRTLRFNRIIFEGGPIPENLDHPGIIYLKGLLEGKRGYVRVNKARSNGKYDRYYAEVYLSSSQGLQLKDVNHSLKNPHRIDGLVNVNDLLVSKGYASYRQRNNNEFLTINSNTHESMRLRE